MNNSKLTTKLKKVSAGDEGHEKWFASYSDWGQKIAPLLLPIEP